MPELAKLEPREEQFIHFLLQGRSPCDAAKMAGYEYTYGKALERKLSKYIIDATNQYLALHGPQAARKVISALEDEMPNKSQIDAAKDILNRIGAVSQDNNALIPTVKANIFILPEKKQTEMITINE
jgi:hypothetical protein